MKPSERINQLIEDFLNDIRKGKKRAIHSYGRNEIAIEAILKYLDEVLEEKK